ALARNPRVHARVRAHDFLVAHIEAARDVRERVVVADERLLHDADDVGGRIDLEAMRRYRLGNRRHLGRFLFGLLLVPAAAVLEQRTSGEEYERERGGEERPQRESLIHGGSMTSEKPFILSAFHYS